MTHLSQSKFEAAVACMGPQYAVLLASLNKNVQTKIVQPIKLCLANLGKADEEVGQQKRIAADKRIQNV